TANERCRSRPQISRPRRSDPRRGAREAIDRRMPIAGLRPGHARARSTGPRMNAFRIAVFLVAALCGLPSLAQDYPMHPVRVIVPFSPGGAVDGPMRVIAQELSKRLGQQVFVENKPGAGATIGSEIVAKAAPDGYTLLLASQTNAISASLYRALSFD